ncbi:MAG: hypothetical protein ACUVQY_08695 [Thermoproteota archaeon]
MYCIGSLVQQDGAFSRALSSRVCKVHALFRMKAAALLKYAFQVFKTLMLLKWEKPMLIFA